MANIQFPTLLIWVMGLLGIITLPACTHVDGQYQPTVNTISFDEGITDAKERIEGVSIVGSPKPVTDAAFGEIKKIGAEWVALLPYAFGSQSSSELHWNNARQWWGETKRGLMEESVMARKHGLKLMVKPQIWFHHGYYTGDFVLEKEEDWKVWEQKYEAFILDYAQLADTINAEMFCIGTELKLFVQERPAFWMQLISKVRNIYSGQLTYAGNWDNYARIPFYSQLDWIGIDAYFPLSESRTPSVSELEKGWQPIVEEIEKVVKKHKKPVIFTEYGYKSVDFAAARPWEHRSGESVNLEAQQNGYEALFKVFSQKPWFGGGFLWNWYPNHAQAGGSVDKDFTPQNKPAQKTTQKWYNPQD